MLVGHVDQLLPNVVSGWAADTDAPEAIVSVLIYVDDHRLAAVACDRERPDLHARSDLAGNLRHGFRFEFSQPLNLDRVGRVTVRFARSGAVLTDGKRAGGRRQSLAPILVTAPARSGTTFLMGRLAKSPRICVAGVPPYEVRLLAYWSYVYRTLTADADSASTHRDRLEGDGLHVGSNPFSHDDYAGAFSAPGLAEEYFTRFAPEAVADLVRTVVGEYYLRVQDDKDKQDAIFFAEKSNNVDRLGRVMSRLLYPRLKEIVIIRDPRDIFCSRTAFFHESAENAFEDVGNSCREMLRIWRNAIGQEIFLKYEDLIADNSDSFTKLSGFLGVADLARRDVERENALFQVHATSKSPTDSIGRWRDLPADVAGRCNAAWEEFLDTFGYER
ncbi:MAG: sulfotransferase [Rhodospirillales bacterium]|nr:sulfotransferase [Rhodospirillales bacterium]